MKLNKYDLAIVGEMVTLLSQKCEPKACSDIVQDRVNGYPKYKISIDQGKIDSFIKKLQKNELKTFGFKGGNPTKD
tara:strand:- start:250 stop:477 length:228 start_codon:yes stop_codon:yes gene_type:complete